MSSSSVAVSLGGRWCFLLSSNYVAKSLPLRSIVFPYQLPASNSNDSSSSRRGFLHGSCPSSFRPSSSPYSSAQTRVPKKKKRKRLDEVCVEKFQQYSRSLIQSWIMQGKVLVDGKVVSKAGTPISNTAMIEIIAQVPKYVCRGGHKLEAAIEQLNIDVQGKVALDSGLSTGGFTDCLLQYGASFVYGVDVGYGQVMPAVVNLMKPKSTLVTLVKPQFEARRSQVGSGGIVRDPEVHKEVIQKILQGVEKYGFSSQGWIESPLKGAEGNKEFLVYFRRECESEGIGEPEHSYTTSIV